MIAACPKCQAKYRVDTAQIGPEGARLRCAKCQAVFRVRAPEAAVPVQAQPAVAEVVTAPPPPEPPTPAPVPAPVAAPPPVPVQAPVAAAPAKSAPDPFGQSGSSLEPTVDRERLILIADADVEAGKAVIGQLAAWGLQPVLVHDGVEALLTVQRLLPRAVVLDAGLAKMYGFQVCEMIKRNESLRSTHVALVGTVHHRDRYRRPPNELYGADVYIEKPELLEKLAGVLSGFGYSTALLPDSGVAVATPVPLQTPPAAMPEAVAPVPAPAPAPSVAEAPALAAPTPVVAEAPAPPPPVTAAAPPAPDDGLGELRANAERLARIIVSDIVLYHPDAFEQAIQNGNVAEALASPIQEGRGFFNQRVDARIKDERDFLMEELARVARERQAK